MIDSELQYLSELYRRMGTEFELLKRGADPVAPSALVQCILRNQDLFTRLEQMNGRLTDLAAEWEKLSPSLDEESQKRTRQLAQKVRSQGVDLLALCDARVREVENLRARLGWELSKIGTGVKYLESLKPLKTNFPKFIDSCG